MKNTLVVAALTFLLLGTAAAQTYDVLRVGDAAPDFSLPYATKDSIGASDLQLSKLIGRSPIVLAFYPADWSGGCTKEVCTFRDNFSSLADLHAQVIGISGDYEYAHHQWAKEQNLPFILASDHKHDVAKTYNSYNEPAGYNKRTVYVIDKAGKIAYIDQSYSVKDMTSFDHLREAIAKLK